MGTDQVTSKVLSILPDEVRARAGEKVYEAFVAVRRKLLGVEVGQVTIEPGRDIAYLEIDGGKDETILFLHGFADSKDTFYDAAQHLVQDYNIICPDLPGFGKSFKRRNETYDIENYGRWLCAFIENINLEGFHIAGNSLGGAAAIQVALMIPEKIKTMTLVDPAGVFIPEPYSLHHELFDGHVIFDVHNRDEFEYFLKRVFTKPPFMPYPVKDFIYKEFHRHGLWHRKVLSDLIMGLSSDEDPRLYEMALNKKLKNIQVPTFLLWGDDDSFFPKETALLMAKEIPDAEVHYMTNTGHCPQIESPKRFASIFKKYLHKQCLRIDRLEKQKVHQLGGNVARGFDPEDRPKPVRKGATAEDSVSSKTDKKQQKPKGTKKKTNTPKAKSTKSKTTRKRTSKAPRKTNSSR